MRVGDSIEVNGELQEIVKDYENGTFLVKNVDNICTAIQIKDTFPDLSGPINELNRLANEYGLTINIEVTLK